MKTIQFTGTQDKIENLHLALGISDNDMPQQSETRVYVVDTHKVFNIGEFDEPHYVIRFINVPKFD